MDIGHQQRPCFVYEAPIPADPCESLRHGLDTEEGVRDFRQAQESAFQAVEEALTAAALLKDTGAPACGVRQAG